MRKSQVFEHHAPLLKVIFLNLGFTTFRAKSKSGTQVDALCGCDCHFGACRSIVQHLALATAFNHWPAICNFKFHFGIGLGDAPFCQWSDGQR